MGSVLESLKKRGSKFAKKSFSTKKEVARRLSICKKCDKYIEETSTCKACGCFMILKVKIKKLTCPIGKW